MKNKYSCDMVALLGGQDINPGDETCNGLIEMIN